jgi:DNA polymerase-1
MTPKEPVYLIDGSAYIYRAYHAITALTNSSGLPTNAVLGFTNTLLRVLREKNPKYLAVAFDAKGPTFRHQYYPDYKANRPAMPDDLIPQIPYIKDIVAAYNFLTLEKAGVEADDLIASAARVLAAAGWPVVVVSGDKDLLQLVSDRITFWEPMKDSVLDVDAVQQKYNVTPEQLLDLFALVGDKSDNIPGVAGIGPKTAEKLINEFGSLDGVYANLDGLKKNKLQENLANHRQVVYLSKKLIRLQDDLDVPAAVEAYALPEPDMTRLKALFTELEFVRLLKSEIPSAAVSTKGFHLVRDRETLAALVSRLQSAPWLVIDTETSALDPFAAELAGLSLCVDGDNAYYIAIGHRDDGGGLKPGQLAKEEVIAALRPFLEDNALPKIGHNLKFDYKILCRHGVTPAGPLWDTMIASYLLNPGRRSHKLDTLGQELLDLRLTTFAEVTRGDKRPDSFIYVDLEEAKNYSCEDVYATFRLWELFREQLNGQGLWELFAVLETPLVPILAEMELAGIMVNTPLLSSLSKEFDSTISMLEFEIHRLAGEEFNINSPAQLGDILFDKLNLPHGRKTKTGYSTDSRVLEKLAHHEIVQAVMAHRNMTKLKTTYVDKLAALVHPATGRVHTSFNQTVTATGRLSSSNPNLQNIPIRTTEGQRIREAFTAAPGHLFLAGDYSQIDLRVLAHYSQDEELLAAFRNNQDIHSQTAAEIYMVSPLLITKEMRRAAKTINFGIVYGMSSFGLAEQLGVSRQAAQTFIDRYFECYTGVKRFMSDIVQQARKAGYVTTLLHRRRFLPDINSSNRTRREFAERTAINTPIQGTAADIIKLAMIKASAALKKKGAGARMLLQIHDELVFEVPEQEITATRALVREAMESVMDLDVPLVANFAVGRTLAEV